MLNDIRQMTLNRLNVERHKGQGKRHYTGLMLNDIKVKAKDTIQA